MHISIFYTESEIRTGDAEAADEKNATNFSYNGT